MSQIYLHSLYSRGHHGWSSSIRVALLRVLGIIYKTLAVEETYGPKVLRFCVLFRGFCHNEFMQFIVLGFVLGSSTLSSVAILIHAAILGRS